VTIEEKQQHQICNQFPVDPRKVRRELIFFNTVELAAFLMHEERRRPLEKQQQVTKNTK
jgi:hypothetical protein